MQETCLKFATFVNRHLEVIPSTVFSRISFLVLILIKCAPEEAKKCFTSFTMDLLELLKDC